MEKRSPQGARGILLVAGLVIIVAGMKAAETILVPFLLSAFLSVICAGPVLWLERKRVPLVLAILIVVLGVMSIGVGMGVVAGTSLNDFTQKLPTYRAHIEKDMAVVLEWARAAGIELSRDQLLSFLDPGATMMLAANMLSSLGAVLANSFLITLTVIFILLEVSAFSRKLRAAVGDAESPFMEHFKRFAAGLNSYLAIKTAVSLATGLGIGIWVAIVGLDFPLLWGLLAFLFNYIPNIGSILAALPAVILAFIQLGPGEAGAVAVGFVTVNFVLGNLIEPRFQGQGLGLSTLIVFMSLVFWGFVFGTVGMFLSIPLTMSVKIALESNQDTQWIAVLLGPDIKKTPPPKIQNA